MSLVFILKRGGLCPISLVTLHKKRLILGSHAATKKEQCSPSQLANSFPSLNLKGISISSSYDHKLGAVFVIDVFVFLPAIILMRDFVLAS